MVGFWAVHATANNHVMHTVPYHQPPPGPWGWAALAAARRTDGQALFQQSINSKGFTDSLMKSSLSQPGVTSADFMGVGPNEKHLQAVSICQAASTGHQQGEATQGSEGPGSAEAEAPPRSGRTRHRKRRGGASSRPPELLKKPKTLSSPLHHAKGSIEPQCISRLR